MIKYAGDISNQERWKQILEQRAKRKGERRARYRRKIERIRQRHQEEEETAAAVPDAYLRQWILGCINEQQTWYSDITMRLAQRITHVKGERIRRLLSELIDAGDVVSDPIKDEHWGNIPAFRRVEGLCQTRS